MPIDKQLEVLGHVIAERHHEVDEEGLFAIRSTLIFCQSYREEIVSWLQEKKDNKASFEADLEGHPAVQAVRKEFPDATIDEVRDLTGKADAT